MSTLSQQAANCQAFHSVFPPDEAQLAPVCRNPVRCRNLATLQLDVLPQAISLHEAFLMHKPHAILASEHAIARIAARGFSYEEVISVIECCEPVGSRDFQKQVDLVQKTCGDIAIRTFKLKRYGLLIKGEADEGRTLMVVCRYGEQPHQGTCWELNISTVYDPSSRASQWAPGFTQQTCFCSQAAPVNRIEDLLVASAARLC